MHRFLIAGLLVCNAAAQTHNDPPLLIQLLRAPAGATFLPPYPEAQAAINVFGLSAVTGPSERWLIEAHYSFGSIEQLNEAVRRTAAGRSEAPGHVSGELLGEAKNLIAVFRAGLSYRPDQAIRTFSKARYFYVSIYRVRTGTESDFSDLLRIRRDSLDNINLDRPDLAYQVISGAPSGTYLLLAPLASLKTLDDGIAKRAYHAEPGSTGQKAANKVAESELGRMHLLFRVEPAISYVSDEFAAESQEFWRGKP